MSARAISERLGIHKGTASELVSQYNLKSRKLSYHDIRYKLSDIQKALAISRHNQFNRRFVTPSTSKTYDDYWKLDWDEFILGCDTHIPHYHEGIYNRMLEFAEKRKIKNFIHPGDFWDQTFAAKFDVAPEDTISISEETMVGKNIIKSLKSVFTDIRFTLGSHDIRLWLNLLKQGKSIPFDEAWNLTEEKVKVSQFRYAEIGDEWRVTHPKNVMRVGSSPAVKAVAKFNRSIVFGHGHWWGIASDISAKHYVIAPGCLVDGKRIAYKSLWDTSHDEWVPGFLAVVDRNKPILFKEDSPWEIYLNTKGK